MQDITSVIKIVCSNEKAEVQAQIQEKDIPAILSALQMRLNEVLKNEA